MTSEKTQVIKCAPRAERGSFVRGISVFSKRLCSRAERRRSAGASRRKFGKSGLLGASQAPGEQFKAAEVVLVPRRATQSRAVQAARVVCTSTRCGAGRAVCGAAGVPETMIRRGVAYYGVEREGDCRGEGLC